MIGAVDLNRLLNRYGVYLTRTQKKQLRDYTDYSDILEILEYLVNELNIKTSEIEKYSEILNQNKEKLERKYTYLTQNNIYNYNDSIILQILNTEEDKIKETSNYLIENYGIDIINKDPSILCIEKDRIINIEHKYKDILSTDNIINAILSNQSLDEISETIDIFKKNNIELPPQAFNNKPLEIESIIDYCTKNNIRITSSIFNKDLKTLQKVIKLCEINDIPFISNILDISLENFEKLVEQYKKNDIDIKEMLLMLTQTNGKELAKLCERHSIEINKTTLNTPLEEAKNIIKICKSKNVQVTESMLHQSALEVNKIIDYCIKNKIAKKNITNSFFTYNVVELEKSFKVCDKYGIRKEEQVFLRTADEITKIYQYCQGKGIKLEYSMFKKQPEEFISLIEFCGIKKIPICNEIFDESNNVVFRTDTKLKRLKLPFFTTALLRTPDEIDEIVKYCRNNNIRLGEEIFRRTPEEVKTIVDICKKHNIRIVSGFFERKPDELRDLTIFCETNNIEIRSSMLNRTKEEILDILEICDEYDIKLQETMYERKPDEVEEIINIYKKQNTKPKRNAFKRSPAEVQEIIRICSELGIPPKETIYKRTPEEIIDITRIYHDILHQNPINNAFNKSPLEVAKILRICKAENIEVTSQLFNKNVDQLKDTIDLIKQKYGEEYLYPQVIICDKNQVERVFDYLVGRGYIKLLKNSQSILKLTLEEIIDREVYILSIGENIVTGDNFNPIFGLSKQVYEARKNSKIKTSNNQEENTSNRK